MKQKSYSFEHVDGASDHVELHRSRGHRFHFFAKLMCLLFALIFWLIVQAVGMCAAQADHAGNDEAPDTQQVEDTSALDEQE